MRLSINPIICQTEAGSMTCTEAEVSLAVSDTLAIRLVPVDADGTEYPDAASAIVGDSRDPEIAAFLEALTSALINLLSGRGA